MTAIQGSILGLVKDLVSDLLYYNRKEDEDIPVGRIEEAIKNGDITVKEIVDVFERELREAVK